MPPSHVRCCPRSPRARVGEELMRVAKDDKGLCVRGDTRLPTKPLLQTLPPFAPSSSAVTNTLVSSHQVLVDKLTSHLQGSPPPSLYGILAGGRGSFCHKFFTLRLHIQVPAANNGAEGYFQHLTLSTNIVFKSLRLTCGLLTGIFA